MSPKSKCSKSLAGAHFGLVVPLLLVITAMAAPGLSADLIWYDELTAISHAGGVTGPFSPIEVIESVRVHSPKHTPFFFGLVAGWGSLVGWHHVVLRIMALYFGVISLAWVFRVGADFVDRWSGIWAAAFLGLNVFWLDYWHELRMYSLQFGLIMALAWHYFYLVSGTRKIRPYHWLGLTLFATLGLYTQPFTIFFHIGLGIYHLLFAKRSGAWYRVALAMVVAGLLYLPWLPVTLTGLTTRFDTAFDAITLDQALGVFVRLLSNGNPLLLIVFFGTAVLALPQRGRSRGSLKFWFMAAAVLALLLAANEAVGLIPLRRSRYFFVTWGMWALVIGSGLAWFKWRWVALVILAVYLHSGMELRRADDYLLHQGTVGIVHAYPPMAEYVEALRGKTQAHDFLVGFSATGFVNTRGKRGKSTGDYYLETLLGIDGAFVPTSFQGESLQENLPAMLDDHPHLLLTYNPAAPPANLDEVVALLERDYLPCHLVLDEPSLRVQRYTDRALKCDRIYQAIHYENGIRVVDKFADHDRDGNAIRVVTGWEVTEPELLELFNVSIQIISDDWQNMRQAPDRHLYDDVLKWYSVVLSTAELPAGDYRVVVIVYDRHHSSAKVSGVDQTSGELGTIMPIYHFTVDE